MTLFTLDINRKYIKTLIAYCGVSIFCLIFFLIYDRFSHGVRSPYMTYMFAFPLMLGAFPGLVFMFINEKWHAGRISYNLYNSGVAAITASSLLKGIFDIAGNSSVYQPILMKIGISMILLSIICFIAKLARAH